MVWRARAVGGAMYDPDPCSDRLGYPMTSLEFATAARTLGLACHRLGLKPASFRCPPRIPNTSRSIRKLDNGYVVSVEIKTRPAVLVQEDMIRGIMKGNDLYDDDYVFLDALRQAVLYG